MDKATLIGIVAGFGLILAAIALGGQMTLFANLSGALIVVGGTASATLISENLQRVLGAIKVARNAFRESSSDAAATIAAIVKLSGIARREGVLALENQKVDDVFLAKGLRMAADGLPQEEIKANLSAELVSMKQRHQRGQKLFRFMGATSPAMGMIGTLIGLVQMLATMDDPSSIGPAMALALLTTLYGAVMAFLIFNPIADKLERRTSEESTNMIVVIEGIESIVKGQHSTAIQEKRGARLEPSRRKSNDAKAA